MVVRETRRERLPNDPAQTVDTSEKVFLAPSFQKKETAALVDKSHLREEPSIKDAIRI
jgi:hypothetical protein